MTPAPPPPPPGGDPRYGGDGRPTVTGPAAAGLAADAGDLRSGAGLDPLSNRLLWIAGLCGVLLVAVLLNALLVGGGGLNPVAEAAQRTAAMPGAKLALEVTYSREGSSTTITGHGSGAYDAKSGLSEVGISVDVPGRAPITVTTVGNERNVFLRSASFAGELPPGKSWLGLQPLLGADPETAFGSSAGAKSTIEMLDAVGGGVERLDQQEVRGHLTTRYKGSIDVSHAAELARENGAAEVAQQFEQIAATAPDPIPVEVWIDANGLARRIRIVQPLPIADGSSLTMDTKMELFDFGAQPKIALPPKHAVLETTPLLRAERDLTNGNRYAHLIGPASADPLTPAAFRSRANSICRDGRRLVAPLISRAHSVGSPFAGEPAPARRRDTLRAFSREIVTPLLGHYRNLLRRLGRVPPPPAESAEYETMLRNLAVELEMAEAEQVAMELGSSVKTKTIEGEIEARESGADALTRRLGLGDCIDPHGRPGGHSESSAA